MIPRYFFTPPLETESACAVYDEAGTLLFFSGSTTPKGKMERTSFCLEGRTYYLYRTSHSYFPSPLSQDTVLGPLEAMLAHANGEWANKGVVPVLWIFEQCAEVLRPWLCPGLILKEPPFLSLSLWVDRDGLLLALGLIVGYLYHYGCHVVTLSAFLSGEESVCLFLQSNGVPRAPFLHRLLWAMGKHCGFRFFTTMRGVELYIVRARAWGDTYLRAPIPMDMTIYARIVADLLCLTPPTDPAPDAPDAPAHNGW